MLVIIDIIIILLIISKEVKNKNLILNKWPICSKFKINTLTLLSFPFSVALLGKLLLILHICALESAYKVLQTM